jgi:hypothetical protein
MIWMAAVVVDGFFFYWSGFFCKENVGLCFSVGGEDHCF